MSVFIRKERLGSGAPPRPDRFKLPSKMFKGGVPMNALSDAFQRAKEQAEEKRKEAYESNAEVQRHRTQLTSEEKMRGAIDRMMPTAKAVETNRLGREATDDEARKKLESLAYKHDKNKE